MAKSVRTRSESSRSRTGFVCKNPWHNAWGSEDLSKRAKPVRKSILEVFSDVAGYPVTAICRACREKADTMPEVVKHSLYTGVSVQSS